MNPNARERFAEIARGPEGKLDLALAALLIAAEERPELNVEYYLAQLDALAGDAAPRVASARTELERIDGLSRFLYSEAGFCGNRKSYYDPRNSFLDAVIERRTGLPITLAIIYMEVARRLGWNVRGVSFPSHFLCKHLGESEIIIDPFTGAILTPQQCEAMLRYALGGHAVLEPRHLRAARPRQVLVRLLNNLKHVYFDQNQLEKSLGCCERILMLVPASPRQLRDRGFVYLKLECFGAAVSDFERFLHLAPDDPSADAVRHSLVDLRRRLRQIH